jgi:hypothetical protein
MALPSAAAHIEEPLEGILICKPREQGTGNEMLIIRVESKSGVIPGSGIFVIVFRLL